jgi:hypothetical protein
VTCWGHCVELVGEQFFVSSPPEYPMPCHAPQAELFDVCAPLGISLGSALLLAHTSVLAGPARAAPARPERY